MDNSRRDFLQRSATAATAVALGPVTASESLAALEPAAAPPNEARA